MKWSEAVTALPEFESKLRRAFNNFPIWERGSDRYFPDHLCIRLPKVEEVKALRGELSGIGDCFDSSVVNGRVIHLYELRVPLKFCGWDISCLELPLPKQTQQYELGWEHVEFVLPHAANTMDGVKAAVRKLLGNETFEQAIQHLNYKESVPEAEGDQMPNPTVSFSVEKATVKFHAVALQQIVTGKCLVGSTLGA